MENVSRDILMIVGYKNLNILGNNCVNNEKLNKLLKLGLKYLTNIYRYQNTCKSLTFMFRPYIY